jgi:hypothetical protein
MNRSQPRVRPIRLEDLPSPATRRWVARRKAMVVAAIHAGLLTLEEACARYGLSLDEFLSWQSAYSAEGVRGLRATKAKEPRRPNSPPAAE